jgi:tRNA 2-thiocytidine biosynthesis protein TtcA
MSDIAIDTRKSTFEFNKLHKRLRRQVGEAIGDFEMITEGDKVMVCLSGGKDSYTMLDILLSLQRSAPISFQIVAVHLDQQQPGYDPEVLPKYLATLDIEYHIVSKDTYGIVKRVLPEGKTMCSLCSRLRRGNLYSIAESLGATKIALGHHKIDIVETFFLNLFFGGKLKAMPPKLRSDDGKHIVIRPLAYCDEDDIIEYAQIKEFPIIPCNLCGSQPNLQRKLIKNMLEQWQKQWPGRLETIFTALQNTAPSQLLDRNLFDFSGLNTPNTLN